MAVTVVLALVGGLTGWALAGGGTSGPPAAATPGPSQPVAPGPSQPAGPPAAIATAPFLGALDALSAAPEVHYQSTVPGLGSIDVTATNFGELVGTVTADGSTGQILDVGGKLYLKPPASAFTGVSDPAEATAIKDKWLTGSGATQLVGFDPTSYPAPGELAGQLALALGSHPTLSGTMEVNGVPVVGADTSMGVLFVASAPPYRIVSLHGATTPGTAAPSNGSSTGPSAGPSTGPSADPSISASASLSRDVDAFGGSAGGQPHLAASFTTIASSGGDTTFPDDPQSDAISNVDSELASDVRQLATGSVNTDLKFTVQGNGSIDCSDAGCAVTVTVTNSISSGQGEITGGTISATLTATITIGGESAPGCDGAGSLPLNGQGVLSCDSPAAGAVFAQVDAQKKAQAQQQSAAENGAPVPYQIPFAGRYYVLAEAQVDVAELEQQLTQEASDEGPLQNAYDNMTAAIHRALNRTPAQVKGTMSEGELAAGRANPGLQSTYVGTSIEKAIAADPAVASDPNILYLGASARGISVPDFKIQVGGRTINIDVTGSSPSTISDHSDRSYIQNGGELLLYPSLSRGFLAAVYG